MTPEEYLRLERTAETKSEYLDGEMIAMPGSSYEHNVIVMNILLALGNQLPERAAQIYLPDIRVTVSPMGLYTYPDVVVVCGDSRFEDQHIDTLINPKLIIEVLSESTESYDRDRKFSHYRTVESLREYVLVAQSECRIEQYIRQSDGKWLYTESTDPNASIELTSVACLFPLACVYQKIEFPDPTS